MHNKTNLAIDLSTWQISTIVIIYQPLLTSIYLNVDTSHLVCYMYM